MNVTKLIREAQGDGVQVVYDAGIVKLRGDPDRIEKWVPVLRPYKPEIVAALQGANATGDCCLVRFPDGTARELHVDPPVNREWVQSHYPDATAKPYAPTVQPQRPLTPEQSASIRARPDRIGERDRATISQVLAHCQQDAETFRYFLKRATEPNDPTQGTPNPSRGEK